MKLYRKSLLILMVLSVLFLCLGSISAADLNNGSNLNHNLSTANNNLENPQIVGNSEDDQPVYYIESDDSDMDYGDGTYYSVAVKCNGDPVSYEPVDFYVDDKFYGSDYTDDDGNAGVYLSDLDLGYHTISTVLNNTPDINSINFITVYDDSSFKLVGYNLKKYYGASNRFTVKLTADGNPVSGRLVDVTVSKHTYTIETNENGIASLAINLGPGKYIVTSKSHGKTVRNTINVLKMPSKFKILSGYKIKKGSYFSVKLLDKNNRIIKGKKVVLRINGKNNVVKTGSDGIAKFKIDVYPKTYKISISMGQKEYSAKTVSKYVRILPPDVFVTGRPKDKTTRCRGMVVYHTVKAHYTYVGPCYYVGKVKKYGTVYRKYESAYIYWFKCNKPDYHNEYFRESMLEDGGLNYISFTYPGYTYVKVGAKVPSCNFEKVERKIFG